MEEDLYIEYLAEEEYLEVIVATPKVYIDNNSL